MEVWIRYEEVRNHPPDFRVSYRLYSEEEDGRKNLVFPNRRSRLTMNNQHIQTTYKQSKIKE